MKIKLNKKLLQTLVAGGVALTLTGCGAEALASDEMYNNNIEFGYEDEYNLYEYDEKVNLSLTNLSDETRITEDGLNTPLYTFEKINDNTYEIPSKDFTISFDANGSTYSYPVRTNYGAEVFASLDNNDGVRFNVETNEKASREELENVLNESNIDLDAINSIDNASTNLVKRTNLSYNEYDLVYQRDSFYLNNVLLYEKVNDNGDVRYYSPLRRGTGINNIDVHDDFVKVYYDCGYVNDYDVLENIENNANYFFNNINGTSDDIYYTSENIDLSEVVNEYTTVNEHIEKFFCGEQTCQRYSYRVNDELLVEFGQTNYDNEYYLEDPYGCINVNNYTEEFTY